MPVVEVKGSRHGIDADKGNRGRRRSRSGMPAETPAERHRRRQAQKEAKLRGDAARRRRRGSAAQKEKEAATAPKPSTIYEVEGVNMHFGINMFRRAPQPKPYEDILEEARRREEAELERQRLKAELEAGALPQGSTQRLKRSTTRDSKWVYLDLGLGMPDKVGKAISEGSEESTSGSELSDKAGGDGDGDSDALLRKHRHGASMWRIVRKMKQQQMLGRGPQGEVLTATQHRSKFMTVLRNAMAARQRGALRSSGSTRAEMPHKNVQESLGDDAVLTVLTPGADGEDDWLLGNFQEYWDELDDDARDFLGTSGGFVNPRDSWDRRSSRAGSRLSSRGSRKASSPHRPTSVEPAARLDEVATPNEAEAEADATAWDEEADAQRRREEAAERERIREEQERAAAEEKAEEERLMRAAEAAARAAAAEEARERHGRAVDAAMEGTRAAAADQERWLQDQKDRLEALEGSTPRRRPMGSFKRMNSQRDETSSPGPKSPDSSRSSRRSRSPPRSSSRSPKSKSTPRSNLKIVRSPKRKGPRPGSPKPSPGRRRKRRGSRSPRRPDGSAAGDDGRGSSQGSDRYFAADPLDDLRKPPSQQSRDDSSPAPSPVSASSPLNDKSERGSPARPHQPIKLQERTTTVVQPLLVPVPEQIKAREQGLVIPASRDPYGLANRGRGGVDGGSGGSGDEGARGGGRMPRGRATGAGHTSGGAASSHPYGDGLHRYTKERGGGDGPHRYAKDGNDVEVVHEAIPTNVVFDGHELGPGPEQSLSMDEVTRMLRAAAAARDQFQQRYEARKQWLQRKGSNFDVANNLALQLERQQLDKEAAEFGLQVARPAAEPTGATRGPDASRPRRHYGERVHLEYLRQRALQHRRELELRQVNSSSTFRLAQSSESGDERDALPPQGVPGAILRDRSIEELVEQRSVARNASFGSLGRCLPHGDAVASTDSIAGVHLASSQTLADAIERLGLDPNGPETDAQEPDRYFTESETEKRLSVVIMSGPHTGRNTRESPGKADREKPSPTKMARSASAAERAARRGLMLKAGSFRVDVSRDVRPPSPRSLEARQLRPSRSQQRSRERHVRVSPRSGGESDDARPRVSSHWTDDELSSMGARPAERRPVARGEPQQPTGPVAGKLLVPYYAEGAVAEGAKLGMHNPGVAAAVILGHVGELPEELMNRLASEGQLKRGDKVLMMRSESNKLLVHKVPPVVQRRSSESVTAGHRDASAAELARHESAGSFWVPLVLDNGEVVYVPGSAASTLTTDMGSDGESARRSATGAVRVGARPSATDVGGNPFSSTTSAVEQGPTEMTRRELERWLERNRRFATLARGGKSHGKHQQAVRGATGDASDSDGQGGASSSSDRERGDPRRPRRRRRRSARTSGASASGVALGAMTPVQEAGGEGGEDGYAGDGEGVHTLTASRLGLYAYRSATESAESARSRTDAPAPRAAADAAKWANKDDGVRTAASAGAADGDAAVQERDAPEVDSDAEVGHRTEFGSADEVATDDERSAAHHHAQRRSAADNAARLGARAAPAAALGAGGAPAHAVQAPISGAPTSPRVVVSKKPKRRKRRSARGGVDVDGTGDGGAFVLSGTPPPAKPTAHGLTRNPQAPHTSYQDGAAGKTVNERELGADAAQQRAARTAGPSRPRRRARHPVERRAMAMARSAPTPPLEATPRGPPAAIATERVTEPAARTPVRPAQPRTLARPSARPLPGQGGSAATASFGSMTVALPRAAEARVADIPRRPAPSAAGAGAKAGDATPDGDGNSVAVSLGGSSAQQDAAVPGSGLRAFVFPPPSHEHTDGGRAPGVPHVVLRTGLDIDAAVADPYKAAQQAALRRPGARAVRPAGSVDGWGTGRDGDGKAQTSPVGTPRGALRVEANANVDVDGDAAAAAGSKCGEARMPEAVP